jgi:hypothetical protein
MSLIVMHVVVAGCARMLAWLRLEHIRVSHALALAVHLNIFLNIYLAASHIISRKAVVGCSCAQLWGVGSWRFPP